MDTSLRERFGIDAKKRFNRSRLIKEGKANWGQAVDHGDR